MAALALVPVLAGCVVFKAPPKAKQVDGDTVRLTFTICASSPDAGSCPDTGNSESDADEDEVNIVLIGIRAPLGSKLPRKLTPVRSDVRGSLARNRQFGRVLNDEAPTPVGFNWFGYRSRPRTTDPEDEAKFRVDIGLPDGFDDRRFKLRPTVGFFQPSAQRPADSPIICGEALFDRAIGAEGERACIDSPGPDEVATHIAVPID